MFDSFSGAEILTIAVIALVVFGPHRLPEIARTIGGYLRELRAAVTELRRGIEQEIGPLREPIKEIKEDLSKPVSDVRQTLAQTADAAKAAERDIKRSATKPLGGASTPSGTPKPSAPSAGKPQTPPDSEPQVPPDDPQAPPDSDTKTPQARWIAPEPPTGVSPSDVWEGMGDPLPESIHPPPSADPSRDLEKATEEGAASEGQAKPDEEISERDVQ